MLSQRSDLCLNNHLHFGHLLRASFYDINQAIRQIQRLTNLPVPPPPPSAPPRPFRRLLLYTTLSLTSLSLGLYLASQPYIIPFTTALQNASSRLLSLPPTERCEKINELITSHPLSQHLRSSPEWKESRPHLQMPTLMRQHSLTASTLIGDTKLPTPPLVFTKGEGEELIAISYLGSDLCGHVGIIHGGMLATMLDEGLARCCFAALPSKVGVTARLEIDYRKMCKSNSFVVLKARTERVEGRKAWVKGRVEVLVMDGKAGKGDPWEEKGEVLVEAEGLFIEPKWAKVRGSSGEKKWPGAVMLTRTESTELCKAFIGLIRDN
ncbi:MAG: hypothetical protein Q9170_001759 [Blastenia crenularia]